MHSIRSCSIMLWGDVRLSRRQQGFKILKKSKSMSFEYHTGASILPYTQRRPLPKTAAAKLAITAWLRLPLGGIDSSAGRSGRSKLGKRETNQAIRAWHSFLVCGQCALMKTHDKFFTALFISSRLLKSC